MSAAPLNFDERLPYPPRWWWTRRIVAACMGMLLALVGAWGFWWKTASARLNDQIESIRARGEPILPEEFNPPEIPDEINVAEYLTAAAKSISQTISSPQNSDMEYPAYLPMSAEWLATARVAQAANPKAPPLFRQARQFTKVDWKIRMKTPVLLVLLPGLNEQRGLANHMGDMALLEHLSGNDFEAVEILRDLFHLADAIDEQPFLVSHLVSIGITALTIQQTYVIAPGLRVADDPAPAPTTQPVTPARREQIAALIQTLLTKSTQDRMTRVLQSERMAQLDNVEYTTGKGLLLKPMYRLDLAHMLVEMKPVVAAASQPNLPGANSLTRGAPVTVWPRGSPTWTNMMSYTFTPSLNRFMETDYRMRADAAMAAVVLAARLYQVDHQGKWPANLDELVPRYLPTVPIDPMSSTGKKLGYIILNGGTRPLVYSVGPDDFDNTANGVMPSATPKVGYDHRVSDQWRDLSRFDPPPTTAPSPE